MVSNHSRTCLGKMSIKQKAQKLSYSLNSPVTVPFCPECHSYPCSCDDNIVEKEVDTKPLASMEVSNWPTLRYMDIDSKYG